MNFGLNENTIDKINQIFGAHPQVRQAILYGSRAKGNFKPNSDIDITLIGKEINLDVLNSISLEIDDLLLPYMIDLSIFEQIKDQDLIGHIHRVGKVFYDRNKVTSISS
jgi:predicted nucleotidyltransferase